MSSPNIPKAVLSTPGQCQSGDASMSPYNNIRNKAKFMEFVNVTALQCHNEAHQNRLKNLRKELDYIKSTAWMYDPIENYIGQS